MDPQQTSEVSTVMGDEDSPAERTKAGYKAILSQIPGLSSSLSPAPEERGKGRRVRVLDSDSEYIKLAKQGGHKGLLWHEEIAASTPVEYKPPEWFCAPLEEHNKKISRVINGEEKKNPGGFRQLDPPFGTDNMTTWERGDESSIIEKINSSNLTQAPLTEGSQQPLIQAPEINKFKRIVFDKKPAPVNMSKLLSFGYADDKHSFQP